MIYNNKRNLSGFTLVELLIAIALIGILSGVAISVLNPTQQRLSAEDGVKRSNVSKIIDAVEAYNGGEQGFPLTADFCNASSIFSKTYMSKCPNGEPNGAVYTYASDGITYGVAVTKSSTVSDTQCIKFRSSWLKPQDCANCDASSDNCLAAATPPTPSWVPYTPRATNQTCAEFCRSLGTGRTCVETCTIDPVCVSRRAPYGFEAFGDSVACTLNSCSFDPSTLGREYTTKNCCCQ